MLDPWAFTPTRALMHGATGNQLLRRLRERTAHTVLWELHLRLAEG